MTGWHGGSSAAAHFWAIVADGGYRGAAASEATGERSQEFGIALSDWQSVFGNLYYDAHQYPEAVKYYQESLEIDPKATDVRTDMATAYHLMGQPDRAIQEYDAVLKIDGKHANALFNEGMVKWQDKMDWNGAIRSWRRLLEAHPDFAQRDKVEKLIAQAQQHLTMKTGSEAAK